MKLQTTFMLILAASLLFALIGAIVDDFSVNYQETGNISSEWKTKYNYANEINESFSSTLSFINSMREEESGGWKNFLNGMIAVPTAVIETVILVAKSPIYIVSMISGVANDIKIPNPLINVILPILIIMVVGIVIFTIIKFWHRSSV